MRRHTMSTAALAAVVLVAGGAAHAELSKNVINSFRGQLVISKDELPEGKNDKETIAKIKAAQVHELVGTAKADVTAWHFHYSAFVAKGGVTTLKMMFYADGKRYVADKRLDGVDPKSSMLTGDISIDEDEGLAKGKTYTIKLETDKEAVVAQTTLTMK
jgi:hypothetical protein